MIVMKFMLYSANKIAGYIENNRTEDKYWDSSTFERHALNKEMVDAVLFSGTYFCWFVPAVRHYIVMKMSC
jgi:hypothetical protein